MKLRTPLMPSASPLSEEIDNIRRMEDAGASAVVLSSLFEEQLLLDRYELHHHLTHGTADYANLIQEARADALELNIYYIPTDPTLTGAEVEQAYLNILTMVKSLVTIPVAVKLSPFFSNLANMARRLDEAGADGLVLFNRFYQPDIDLDSLTVRPNVILSTPQALRLPLRWIAILYGRVRADLAATSGIHTAQDVIKMLMAGANVTMLCSVLLRHGIGHIRLIEQGLRQWMEEREYKSVGQMRGSVSQIHCENPGEFERAQYVRALHSFKPALA